MDCQTKTMSYRMILAVLAWVVLTAGGCSNKSKNGRFTQEQMNNFPLAQTENP